jgi:ketosteroid isomerase-like protein
MTTDDTVEVAHQLSSAFDAGPEAAQSALCALYADTVELRHVPALPSDGIVEGSRLREASSREAAAIRTAIPDYVYDDVQVDRAGDRVHVKAWIQGTTVTGSPVRLLSEMHCSVRDGRIVGVEHLMDKDTLAAWTEVATAGGLRVPDEMLDQG